MLTEADKAVAMKIVHKNTGPVFSDRTGLMKISPVKLEYEEGFVPTQPHRQIIPYAYQPKLSAHLRNLRRDKVITDVDPSEPIDCILNVTFVKKTEGEIRMNIDMRLMNKGSKHTKYHIPLPQEIRHRLTGAKVFSELDMTHGFHQNPLAPESKVMFQTHKGIHRMH